MTSRHQRFRDLHQSSAPLVLPNPWDLGSARLLVAAGFDALATTSSGFAQTLGRGDGHVSRDELLAHCGQLCLGVQVPVSADLENGYGDSPEAVAETIRSASAVGLSGGSIEDFVGPAHARDSGPLYPLEQAVERIHAAAEAAAALPVPFVLTARAEALLHLPEAHDPATREAVVADTLQRLVAYQDAGAEVLYAPGLATLSEVRRFADALERPINVLGPLVRNASIDDLAAAGAKRISIGGAFARQMAGVVFDWAQKLHAGDLAVTQLGPGGSQVEEWLEESPVFS